MKLPAPSWFPDRTLFKFPIDSELIQSADAALCMDDRLMLYALVVGRCPMRYLEVGTDKGGSALIACAAMDSMQLGSKMVCLDPNLDAVPQETRHRLHRPSFVKGTAPELIPQVVQMLGGSCDFLFLDSIHTYENTRDTLAELHNFLEEDAWLLFHDANNPDIDRAISEYAKLHLWGVVDFGVVTRKSYLQYGGMRLLKMR